MRREIRVLVNIQAAYHLTVVAQNLPTEDNIMTDCLSRGLYVREKNYDESDGPVTWGKEEGYMQEWERYLVDDQEKK